MRVRLEKYQGLAVAGMTVNGVLLLLFACWVVADLFRLDFKLGSLLLLIVAFLIIAIPPVMGWVASRKLYRTQSAAGIRQVVGCTVFYLGLIVLYGGIHWLFPREADHIIGPITMALIFCGCVLSVLLYIIIVRPALLWQGYKYLSFRQAFPAWTVSLLAILLYLTLSDEHMAPVNAFEQAYPRYGWLVRVALCVGLYYLGKAYFSEDRTASRGETEAPQIGLYH